MWSRKSSRLSGSYVAVETLDEFRYPQNRIVTIDERTFWNNSFGVLGEDADLNLQPSFAVLGRCGDRQIGDLVGQRTEQEVDQVTCVGLQPVQSIRRNRADVDAIDVGA